MSHQTQQRRILALLERYSPNWCPLPEILDLHISQYGTRIRELRQQGFRIENRIEQVGRERHSWFRLVPKGQGSLFQ